MTHIYVRIDADLVVEIIQPMSDGEGNEIPIVSRFTSEFVATCVDITSVVPAPQYGWSYNGSTFGPPSS